MAAVNSEREMELIITLAYAMLTYPIYFYDPVIPKLGLSARSHVGVQNRALWRLPFKKMNRSSI